MTSKTSFGEMDAWRDIIRAKLGLTDSLRKHVCGRYLIPGDLRGQRHFFGYENWCDGDCDE